MLLYLWTISCGLVISELLVIRTLLYCPKVIKVLPILVVVGKLFLFQFCAGKISVFGLSESNSGSNQMQE